jgi:outer membrane protein TolC
MDIARRLTLILIAGPLPALVAACQRYAPSPLDLAAHQAALAARDPAAASVVAYARRLEARSGAAPPRYEPADGLSLEEAEVVALLFNPQLRLARLKADVPRVGAAEAGRWEDPELGVDAERILESVERPWVIGGTLGFTVPLSGRLGSQKRKATAEATAAAFRALADERRVLAELRAAWVEWSAAGERAALTRRLVDELSEVAGRAEQLRAAGELGPLEARVLQLERLKQTARLRGHEADGRASEFRLRALLGLSPSAGVKLVPSLDVPEPALPSDDALPRHLTAHPRLRVARAEYAVAERSLELEVRRQYPDLRLGGGFGTDEGDHRALFGAAIPLPLFNANRQSIAEARAGRDAAKAAAEGAYEQLVGEVAAARSALRSTAERLEYIEHELAPLADRQVEDAVRLGRAGELNALLLLEALTTAHEAKLELLDARVATALARRSLDTLLDTAGAGPAAKD